MSLTDAKLRALRGRGSPFKVADGEGLYVLVAPNGSRLWRLAYRYLGKQKTLAMGKYPQMSLLEARRAREEAKRQLAGGSDPAVVRKRNKREKLMSAGNTFEAVANEWFALNEGRWVKTYASRLRGRLDGDLLPALGKRPIAEIEPLEVLDAIRGIEKRDAIEMAKRVMQMASGVFRYGVATAKCRRDPTADLRGALQPSKPTKNRAALAAAELPIFMTQLKSYDGDEFTRLGLELLVLTFVRTGELRFARRPEFENLEGQHPLWRIPSERMKMRRPHLVPLAPRAVTIVRRLQTLAGKSEYLFPATTKAGVISENTLLFALYRMGYHKRATVHGFRSTASTILNEAEFNRDWVEMQLAHFDGSVRGVYNAAEWLSGRREMMVWWATHIDQAPKLRLAS
jgi:integrase